MDFDYDEELKGTYSEITASGGELVDTNTSREIVDNNFFYSDLKIEPSKELWSEIEYVLGSKGLIQKSRLKDFNKKYPNFAIIFNNDGTISLKNKIPVEDSKYVYTIFDDYNSDAFKDVDNWKPPKNKDLAPEGLQYYYDSELKKKFGKKYPNLDFSYDFNTNKVIIKKKTSIEDYCKENSIYYPDKREEDTLAKSKLSFNIADIEELYYQWIEESIKSSEDGNALIGGTIDYSLNPLSYAFHQYTLERKDISYPIKTEDLSFNLESFIAHMNTYGLQLYVPFGNTGYTDFITDFEFDKSTGLLSFNTGDLLSDSYTLLESITYASYRNKVANDINNGNTIQYRASSSYLVKYLKANGYTYNGKEITEDNIEAFLASNGLRVAYTDGDYLFFDTKNISKSCDQDFLAKMLHVENNSDSLYKFDFEQLEKKSNCSLGISGMELGETYINSVVFDKDSDEYKQFVETYGEIGKLYSSTYNGFTVFVPQTLENGKYTDAFTNVPKVLYNKVNSNTQSLEDFGYSLSVRIDSMKDFEPSGFSCKDYKNVVAITDDNGVITGYKIILNNNQYEIVNPNDKGKYTLWSGNPTEETVDKTIKGSTAYDCMEITNYLRGKYNFADAKYSDGKYYLTINGEQIVLNEDEVRGPYNTIQSNLVETINSKSANGGTKANNVTIYNRNIVNKPKCISFDDETNYRGLVDYLKNNFKIALTVLSSKINPVGSDNKDIYGKIKMGIVKTKLTQAAIDANAAGVKIQTSVNVLKTYDSDLKSIFDLMVNDVFKLGTVDKNNKVIFDGDMYYYKDAATGDTSNVYESKVIGDNFFYGSLDDYIDSLAKYCDDMYKKTDSAFKWALKGMELTQEDIDLLNNELDLKLSLTKYEDGVDEKGNPKYRYYLNTAGLEAMASTLLRKNGDGFNLESWLNDMTEKNPAFTNISNEWDYYNAMINNTDNIANDLALYKKVQKAAPLAKYACTDEYDEILSYLRSNYDKLTLTGDFQYTTLEELSLFLMDSRYNKKSDWYSFLNKDNGKEPGAILTLLKEMSGEITFSGYEDNCPLNVGNLFLDHNIDYSSPLCDFLTNHGINELKDRIAKGEAVKTASKNVKDGALQFWEQGCHDGFFDGLLKYGKNTTDFIYCGLAGKDSPWTERDTKNKYLLELYAGDYTKSEVEEMYRNGQITKDDYDVRMQVLKEENTIKYDFQKVKNVSGFIESIGSGVADVAISMLPEIGPGLLSILKASSAAGKTARKLHDAGNGYWETLGISVINGLATYFLSKGLKDLKKSRGGHLITGNGTRFSEKEIAMLREAKANRNFDILEELNIDLETATKVLSWHDFYNGKVMDGVFDAGKEFFMGGNGLDKLATTFVTTAAYSAWQKAKGEDVTSYTYEKYFTDDVFGALNMFENGKYKDRALKTGGNVTKNATKNVIKWLLGLV